MHFDPPVLRIKADAMRELVQVEIGAECTVDMAGHIQIEGCCDTCRIVIRCKQLGQWLLKVSSKEKRVSGQQGVADLPQEILTRRPVEIPNRASEEQDQQPFT